MTEAPLLLFDGVCNLCNRSVQFVIRHDRKQVFRFAPLQGETARRILAPFGERPEGSVILVHRGILYTRSAAVLETLRLLGGAWGSLYVAKVIPKYLRDKLYDWIASHRYRWFGKREACMVPTPELQSRFL